MIEDAIASVREHPMAWLALQLLLLILAVLVSYAITRALLVRLLRPRRAHHRSRASTKQSSARA